MKKLIFLLVLAILVFAGLFYGRSLNHREQLIGGQTDEHGCLGSAGYTWCQSTEKCQRMWEEYCEEFKDQYRGVMNESGEIRLVSPRPEQVVESPLIITGEARGNWFFEGDFPVILTDWDGRIIAESFATAQGEWMTEEFVPFSATFEFEKPTLYPRGALILKKDNPSDLPENDDYLEITINYYE